MKIVICMGAIYKLTDASYKAMLKEFIENQDCLNVDKWGTLLAYSALNITDLNPEQAMEELDLVESSKVKRSRP